MPEPTTQAAPQPQQQPTPTSGHTGGPVVQQQTTGRDRMRSSLRGASFAEGADLLSPDRADASGPAHGQEQLGLYAPVQRKAHPGHGPTGQLADVIQLKPDGGPQTPDPGGPDIGPGDEAPELSPAALDLIEQVDEALGVDRPGGKKRKRKARKKDALGLIKDIAACSVHAEVVAALDVDERMSRLFELAGYKKIWGDVATTEATLVLLKDRDPAKCKEDIRQLTSTQIHLFERTEVKGADGKVEKKGPMRFELDIATNRWEARMAWELMLVLPEAEREALMHPGDASQERWDAVHGMKKGKDKRQARKEAKKADQIENAATGKRIDANLSWEYKESSRYDAYVGDDAKTAELSHTTTDPVGKDKPDDGAPVAPQTEPVLEATDDQTLATVDTPETNASEIVGNVTTVETVTTGEDTDRQALLAQALDDALWTKAPEARLRSVLRMVVQAGEGPAIAHQVKAHWAEHEAMLIALGFDGDGSWKEVIFDQTASNWLQRGLAATGAISQVIGFVTGLLSTKVKFRKTVDLQTLAAGFPAMTGVRLRPHERPKDPLAIVGYIFGGAGPAKWVLQVTGLGPKELLDTLQTVKDAGKWFMRKLKQADLVEEGVEALEELLENKPEKKEDDANYLVLEGNELTGEIKVGLPLLDVAATARRSGDSFIKTEASQAAGIAVTIKRRTALSQDRHVQVEIGGIDIAGLMLVGPDSMTTIDTISLRGLKIAFESPEAKPSTWIAKVGHFVQAIGGQILKAMPFGFWLSLARDVALLGTRMTDLVVQLATGLFVDGAKLTVDLGGVDVLGLAESGGDHVDKVAIGESNVTLADERGLGFHTDNLASKKEKKAARLHAKSERKAAELEARKEARDKSGQSTEDMWFLKRALVEGKDRQLEKRAAKLEEKADATDTDIRSADPGDRKEREADLIPERIRRQRDRAQEAIARFEKRLGRDGLSDDKRKAIQEKLDQTKRVAERLDHTIRDHIAITELEWQVEDAQAALADAKKAGDGAKAAAAEHQIAELRGRIGHLRTEALELEATIGPITVEGVDMGGMEIGSVSAEAFEVKQKPSTGPEDKNAATISNARITVKDVAIKDERRRDVAIRLEMNDLEEAAKNAQRALTDDERERLGILKRELDYLKPFVDEYELLRARISELGPEEQERLVALRKQLESPAAYRVKKVEVKHLEAGGAFTLEEGKDGEGHVGSEVGASVGEVVVEGVESRDTAKFAYGGDLTIDHVTATDFGMVFDTETGLGGAKDKSDVAAGLKKGQIDDLTYAGRNSDAKAQREQALAGIAATEGEIAKLSAKTPRSESDAARLAALEGQLKAQRAALASHEEVLAEPGRFKALIPKLEAKYGALEVGGIDYSRGTSLDALFEGSSELQTAIDELSPTACDARIASYAKGIGELEAELAPMKAELAQQESEVKRISALPPEQQRGYNIELMAAPMEVQRRAIAEREALLARAKDAKKAWKKKKAELGKTRKKLEDQKKAKDQLAVVYAEVVRMACDAGLDRVAADNATRLEAISAHNMVKLAEGGVLENEDWHVDQIVIDDLGGGTDLTDAEGTVDTRGSVTINGVEHGDQTVVGELKLAGLGGGLKYDAKANKIALDRFGLKAITLSTLHWEGGNMAAHANAPLTIDELLVTGSYDLGTGTTEIDKLESKEIASGDLLFRYGDMELGAAKGGSLGLKNLAVTELNLKTYDFVLDADISTEKLAVDLTQGMTVGAQAIRGKMHVDALVADNTYDVALSALSADDIALKMPGMGVTVHEIRGGAAKIGADVSNNVYSFGIDVKTLGLGPIDFDGDGMGFHALAGLDLDTVHVEGAATLDDEGAHTKVESLTATHAKIPHLDLSMGEGKDAMSITVRSGSLDDLALSGLDLDTMAMDVTFDNGKLNGLEVAMEGLTLNGGVGVKHMHYAALRGPDGKDLGMLLGFEGVDANLTTDMGTTETVTKEDGSTEKQHHARKIGTVVDDASGEVRIKGDKTSFKDISVKNVTLPALDWESSGSAIHGQGVAVDGITADGYYETYEKEVRGMKLPTSDLVITRLHVNSVVGDRLTYKAGDTEVIIGEVGEGKDKQKKATRLTNLDVVNLRQIDGVMESGHIELEQVEAGAQAAIGGALKIGGALSAEGIFCDFDHGKTSFGVTTVEILSVSGEKEFAHEVYNLPGRSIPEGQKTDKLDRLEFDVPRALLSVLEGDAAFKFLEDDEAAEVHDQIHATVQSFIVMEDALARYYMDEAAPKPPILDEEKSSNDYADEARTATSVLSVMEQLQPMFQDLDVDLFAALSVKGGLVAVPDLHLKVDDGVLDHQALFASLESARVAGLDLDLEKLLKIETKVVAGEVVVTVKLDENELQQLLAVAGGTVSLLLSEIPVLGPALGLTGAVVTTAGIIVLEFYGDVDAREYKDDASDAPAGWQPDNGGTPLYSLVHGATRDEYVKPTVAKAQEVEEHKNVVDDEAQRARVARDGRQHFELPAEISRLEALVAELDSEGTWDGEPVSGRARRTLRLLATSRLMELQKEKATLDGTAETGPKATVNNLFGTLRIAAPESMPEGREIDVAGMKVRYRDLTATFGPSAPNVFSAHVKANDLGIGMQVGAGKLDAKIGWADLGVDARALQAGFLPLGGTDSGLRNPIVGKLPAGSKLENVEVDYKVDAKNHK